MFLIGQHAGWSPSDMLYCEDVDGDGYRVRRALLCPFFFYLNCNDPDPDVNPGGLDNDCDGLTDEAADPNRDDVL